jgi:hypothetical protein
LLLTHDGYQFFFGGSKMKVLTVLMVLALVGLTNAGVILGYDMADTTLWASPSTVAAGVTGGNLTPGLNMDAGTYMLSRTTSVPGGGLKHGYETVLSTAATLAENIEASRTNGSYFTFTLTVGAGGLDLSGGQFSIDASRGGTTGVRGFAVDVDLNGAGFSELIAASIPPTTSGSLLTNYTASLGSLGALAAGDVVTFKVVAYADLNSRTNFYDNIAVIAVPEPATLALLGIGGITALLRRKK